MQCDKCCNNLCPTYFGGTEERVINSIQRRGIRGLTEKVHLSWTWRTNTSSNLFIHRIVLHRLEYSYCVFCISFHYFELSISIAWRMYYEDKYRKQIPKLWDMSSENICLLFFCKYIFTFVNINLQLIMRPHWFCLISK